MSGSGIASVAVHVDELSYCVKTCLLVMYMVNFNVSTGHRRQVHKEEEETTPYLALA